jgi:phospholipid transport system substrate-binding protein
MIRHRSFVVLAVVAALLVAQVAIAGAPTDQLRSAVDRVIKTLDDPAMKAEGKASERREAVRKIANEIFAWDETAKRALARHWQARTEAQRQEFVKLFGDLLERSYIARIENYGGEKITYLSDSVEDETAMVRTKIVTKQGSEVPVDYRMLRRSDRWLVYDVVIEGVSLVSNYRTQFNKIIQTSSYEELVKKLKSKQEEFQEPKPKA